MFSSYDEARSIDVPLMLSSGSKESNEWAVDICLVEITIHLVLVKSIAKFHFSSFTRSDLIAELPRARSGAPWIRKFGKLFIPENLVMT